MSDQAKKQAQPKRLTSEARPAGKQRRSGAGVLDIGSNFDYDMQVRKALRPRRHYAEIVVSRLFIIRC